MEALMVFTAWIWANLQMGQKVTRDQRVTPNESSRNIGKSKWQINKIGIIVLNANVTHYLFLTLKNAKNLKLVIICQSYRAA